MTTSQTLLPGQHAAPDGPVDLNSMYVMHHAFRRDLAAFRTAAAEAPVSDRTRWRALARRWTLFATALHHHHAAEDAGLWPLLRERVAGSGDTRAADVLEAMQAEHARIDPLLDEATDAFRRLAEEGGEGVRAALRRSLDATAELLDGHLGHEERDAMAILQRHLTEEDWLRLEREHFRPAYSPREIVAVVPWAVAGLPAEVRRRALAAGGPVMGVLWRLTHRSFARRDAALFRPVDVPAADRVVDTRSTVAVVGATGTMGGLVLAELVARSARVRVLVRRLLPDGSFPPGVEQVLADLRDEDAVRAALTGVRAVLYISPHDEAEEDLARNFVRAAEATGTRIVFSGVHLPSRNPVEWLQVKLTQRLFPTYRHKFRIGQHIATRATNPVIFIPTNFYQNDEIFEDDIRGGRYPTPMRRVNRLDVRDLAELCADALLQPSYPAVQQMIAGPASLSGEESARTWAEALGRPVRYVGDDETQWVPIFRNRLHGQKLRDLLNTFRFLGRRSVVVPKAVVATTRLLGRPPRGYREYVAETAAATADRVRTGAAS